MLRLPALGFIPLAALVAVLLTSCASTDLIDSPRTAVVSEAAEPKRPELVWSSRTLGRPFDYLGLVRTRAFTYDNALERIVEGGMQLRADAVVDIHYERVGFLAVMEAFAVKYR